MKIEWQIISSNDWNFDPDAIILGGGMSILIGFM